VESNGETVVKIMDVYRDLLVQAYCKTRVELYPKKVIVWIFVPLLTYSITSRLRKMICSVGAMSLIVIFRHMPGTVHLERIT
jgi:hypothetical protein